MVGNTLPTGELSSRHLIPEIQADIAERAARFVEYTGQQPHLLIVSGDPTHDGSRRYARKKQEAGEAAGVHVSIEEPETLVALNGVIDDANQDSSIHGIIVQLPLANEMIKEGADDITDQAANKVTSDVLARVALEKDVDGLAPGSLAIPATAKAVDLLLKGYGVDAREEKVAFIGLGRLVNGPLLKMLRAEGAQSIQGFDEHDSDIAKLLGINWADIIVTATGQPGIITPDLFLPENLPKVIIDAGTAGTAKAKGKSQNGDVSDETRELILATGGAITPVIGGVGPLTVFSVISNTVDAAERQYGITPQLGRMGMVLKATGLTHPDYGENDKAINPYYAQVAEY